MAAHETVDGYIASFPPEVQVRLEALRKTIRDVLPDAEELISYQIPTYKLRGGYVVYFAAWKKHYSLYPATDHLVEAFKDDLAPYEVNDKGTIRFSLTERVPVQLIARLARFRANELAASAEAKGPAKRGAKKAAAKKPAVKKPAVKKRSLR